MEAVSSRTMIIGYGNSLRGDDAVGPYLIGLIEGLNWPGVVSRAVHQLTPDLAADIALAGRVVFVDARMNSSDEPVSAKPIHPRRQPAALSHFCSPETLLELSEVLYGYQPDGWLVSIAGQCFDPVGELSSSVLRNVPLAIAVVQSLLLPWDAAYYPTRHRCMN